MNRRRSLDLSSDILLLLRKNGTALGERIFETRLARDLGVSRAPVRAALTRLAQSGIVAQEHNRGFVLQRLPEEGSIDTVIGKRSDEELYMTIVRDHFNGEIPEIITEQELLRRYGGTAARLRHVMSRGIAEGWLERKRGYGWRFLEVPRQSDAYAQILRLRQVIEPTGLLEPTYVCDLSMIERLRKRQTLLLEKGVDNFSAAELFKDGCEFHEMIAKASGNLFLWDTIKRLNGMRRLYSYQTFIPDSQYLKAHIREHLELLDIMESGENVKAAEFLGAHIGRSIKW